MIMMIMIWCMMYDNLFMNWQLFGIIYSIMPRDRDRHSRSRSTSPRRHRSKRRSRSFSRSTSRVTHRSTHRSLSEDGHGAVFEGHLKLIEQLSNKIAESKSSKSRSNFKRELKAGADIIAFTKFCMQIEIWCANEFPNSKLVNMRGIDSIFLASTNEEQNMDSAIFLQLSSALV